MFKIILTLNLKQADRRTIEQIKDAVDQAFNRCTK